MTDTSHTNEKRTPFDGKKADLVWLDDCPPDLDQWPSIHASDCAVHNAPAFPDGPCDCGALPPETAGQAFDQMERAKSTETTKQAQARGERVRRMMEPEQAWPQEPQPLPSSVRVGFRHYEVIEWDQMDSSCEDRFGDQSMAQARIRVAAGINVEKQANVLLHEVLHACYSQAALNGGEKEEAVVWSLSNVLCQVWQDNPDLIAFLDAALGDKTPRVETHAKPVETDAQELARLRKLERSLGKPPTGSAFDGEHLEAGRAAAGQGLELTNAAARAIMKNEGIATRDPG